MGEEVKVEDKSMEDAPIVEAQIKPYKLTAKKLWALGGLIVSLLTSSFGLGRYMGVAQKDLAVLQEQARCSVITNDFNKRIGVIEIENIILKKQLAEKGQLIQRLAEVVPNDDKTLNGVDAQVAAAVRNANAPKEEKAADKGIINKVANKVVDFTGGKTPVKK
jgi:hypothetical protein